VTSSLSNSAEKFLIGLAGVMAYKICFGGNQNPPPKKCIASFGGKREKAETFLQEQLKISRESALFVQVIAVDGHSWLTHLKTLRRKGTWNGKTKSGTVGLYKPYMKLLWKLGVKGFTSEPPLAYSPRDPGGRGAMVL
jgi:hypothetical protein